MLFIWLFRTVFVPMVIIGLSFIPKQLPIVTLPS
jgi:hypothetical protein